MPSLKLISKPFVTYETNKNYKFNVNWWFMYEVLTNNYNNNVIMNLPPSQKKRDEYMMKILI